MKPWQNVAETSCSGVNQSLQVLAGSEMPLQIAVARLAIVSNRSCKVLERLYRTAFVTLSQSRHDIVAEFWSEERQSTYLYTY